MHDVNIFYKISVKGIHRIIIKKKQPSVTAVPVTEGYLCSLLISNIVFSPHLRIIPSRVHQSQSIPTQRECTFCLARYGRFFRGFLIMTTGGGEHLISSALHTKSSFLHARTLPGYHVCRCMPC